MSPAVQHLHTSAWTDLAPTFVCYASAGVTWEQEAFSDVWFAMLTGSPILGWNAVRNCRLENASEIGKVEGDIIDAELQRVLNVTGSSDKQFDMSQYDWWPALHRAPGFKTKTSPMRIPRCEAMHMCCCMHAHLMGYSNVKRVIIHAYYYVSTTPGVTPTTVWSMGAWAAAT